MSDTIRTFFGFQRNIQIKNRVTGELSSLEKLKEHQYHFRKINRCNRRVSFHQTRNQFIAARLENRTH